MSNPTTHRAFVALGSNLAEPEAQVRQAFAALARLPRTRLLAQSSLYRSAPVGFAEQPDFINAVALIATETAAHDLLESLLEIERGFGRIRDFRNAPRILDLDLLLYGDSMLHEAGLTLPHPRMHERAFVLLPLLEIAPDCVIPGKGRAADWLAHVKDQNIARVA
jgi:2-amino-4-hydroxy-6-hydroxymethyldihydropteridine diphosphokinase